MATQTTPPSEITPRRKSQIRPRGYMEEYDPQKKTRALIEQIQSVLDEYRDHWPLTARQVFYRLVGAHGADKSEKFYKKLCHHLANARRARIIPFDAIRDDGVSTYAMEHFADVDAFRAKLRDMAAGYQRDLMANQNVHVEIWCEAGGMLPQLFRVAERFSIKVYSSGGFDSLTAKKVLADRVCDTGKPCVVLHLGDYDPSGESIFNSVAADVLAFVAADRLHAMVNVEFRRVALTEKQVIDFHLPTSPAKVSDTRSKNWQGGTCQLEALAPNQIAEILEAAISGIIDPVQMYRDQMAATEERADLTRLLLPNLN